jgi:hypothetical protein
MHETEKPRIDRQAPAVPQTAAVVMAMASLQSQAGRLNRLKALARTNQDVAWLMRLADPRIDVPAASGPPVAPPAADPPVEPTVASESGTEAVPGELSDDSDTAADFNLPASDDHRPAKRRR